MRESVRYDSDRDTAVEHLRRHEVTQIVESKMRQTGLATTADKRLRDPVRKPRCRTVRLVRENEPVTVRRLLVQTGSTIPVAYERGDRGFVECDAMRAPGLGRSEHRTLGPFNERSLKRDAPHVEIDVPPTKGEQLSSTSARRGGEKKEEPESRICRRSLDEELRHFLSGGRADLRWHVSGRTRVARWVQPDPFPADGLGERAMQYDMDPVNSARCKRTTFATSVQTEMRIEVVDVRCRELRDRGCPRASGPAR